MNLKNSGNNRATNKRINLPTADYPPNITNLRKSINMVKYKLTVDEPWDFNHNGSNILYGIVVKQLSPTFLLFKSDSFLDFNGQKSCVLILKPRYEKEYFNLETNGDVIVGGALCLENEYEEKNEEYLISHSQYMLIGRIEKINVGNNQLNC